MYWAEADPDFEISEQHGYTQLQQLINLRRQAESHAAQDNLYKRRDTNWISWRDAQLTRLEAIRAYKAAKGRAKRDLLRSVLVVSFLTIQPPDRVGGQSWHHGSRSHHPYTAHRPSIPCSDPTPATQLDAKEAARLGRRGSARSLVDRLALSAGRPT